MKLGNLRKYFFPNLLSVLGYPIATGFMYLRLVYTPRDWANTAKYAQDLEMTGFDSSIYSALFVFISLLLLAVFLFLFLIEFFIRRHNKTEFRLPGIIPQKIMPVYNILFYLGIFFAALPFLYYFFIFYFLEVFFPS